MNLFHRLLRRDEDQARSGFEQTLTEENAQDAFVTESASDGVTTQFEIRPAQPGDEEFILSMILSEAAAGHFNSDLLHPLFTRGLREQISQTVSHRLMPVGPGATKVAELYMLTKRWDREPVGFTWFLEAKHKGIRGCEIYMCALHSSERGKGFGKSFIERSIALASMGQTTLARVLPKSLAMSHILRSLGFEQRGSGSPTLYVRFKKRGLDRWLSWF